MGPRARLAFLAVTTAGGMLLAYPVSTGTLRALALALAALWAAGAFALAWPRRGARALLLAVAAAGAGLLLGPGRPWDPGRLRASYLEELRAYEGTRYVWGGENRLGIDCSGLVRKALVWAELKEGLRTLNPRLLRRAAVLWAVDASAKTLGGGDRGRTRVLGPRPALQRDDTALAGDLAVTADGVHVLACLAPATWIEADPILGRVVVLDVDGSSSWLRRPVVLVRWRDLEPTPSAR